MLLVGLPEQASSFFSQVLHFSLINLFHHRMVSEVQTQQLILEQLRDTRVIIIDCQNTLSVPTQRFSWQCVYADCSLLKCGAVQHIR